MGAVQDYNGLFKAYDIRGAFPKELDAKFAYKLGRAFVLFMKAKEVMVGYDGRSSSKKLFEGLSNGILDQGADVIDVGLVSTPGAYFSMFSGKYSAGIIITASHLSKSFNGFKLMGKGGVPVFYENGGDQIMTLIKSGDFPKPKKKGSKKKKSWSKEYSRHLLGILMKVKNYKELFKDLRVIIDQSNGSSVSEVEALKSVLPKGKVLNSKVSGSFPGHEPDPLSPSTKKKVSAEIRKYKADLGIVFDGDGDRVCFFDEKGNFIRPDVLLSMMLSEFSSGKVIYDTRSSKSVADIAQARGLQGVISKSGRSYIIEAMRNEQAEIGGEGSGHYYFKENHFLDSGGLASIRILTRFAQEKKSGKKMSDLVHHNDLYYHSGEINFKVKNPGKAFLIVEQGFREAKKVLFIDGLSVYYDNFWFNIRKSNTEPLVRVNAEANSKAELDKIIKDLSKIMDLAK